jgi:hypothetical protein
MLARQPPRAGRKCFLLDAIGLLSSPWNFVVLRVLRGKNGLLADFVAMFAATEGCAMIGRCLNAQTHGPSALMAQALRRFCRTIGGGV